jgi:hypothetical protein
MSSAAIYALWVEILHGRSGAKAGFYPEWRLLDAPEEKLLSCRGYPKGHKYPEGHKSRHPDWTIGRCFSALDSDIHRIDN